MNKINCILVLFFLIPIFSNSQNTSNLLVNAVEELVDEGMVITQSINVYNLEQINSDELDYSPVLYKNGILFTSNRKLQRKNLWNRIFNKKAVNLFFAEKIKDGTYKTPVPHRNKMNGKMNEGAITVDASGKFMIYTVNNKSGNDFGLVELQLYSSEYKDKKWSNGIALPINCEGCTICHPSLSSDSKTLYFASNQSGGYGEMDLYMSKFVDGVWGTPINLGPKINTAKNEVFPFINYDGTLYYSSNGKDDLGNLDIYFSRFDNQGEWKKSINIGEPFNSSADDFGFYIEKDGLSGLFSSNRKGGKGMDDIYFWRLDKSLEQALDPLPVKFTIIDEETGDILPNTKVSLVEFHDIKIETTESGAPIAFIGHVNQALNELVGKPFIYQTNDKGNFYHDLKHDRKYMLIVEKENYTTFRKMSTYNLLSGVKEIDIQQYQRIGALIANRCGMGMLQVDLHGAAVTDLHQMIFHG